jgi:hypothetical protein
MNPSVICVDYTIPGGLDWAERGEPEPLSIKHGDCFCVIERADTTVLVLDKGNISENTGRYVKNEERIQLPDGINGRFCKFIELKLDDTDTLCVFVMADDMQTCAVYDWNTSDCYAYGPLPFPLPADALMDRVVVTDANTMQLTYYIGYVPTTITVDITFE